MAILLRPFAFHFVQMFCIKVSWSDGTVNLVYRRYSEFLHLQVCRQNHCDIPELHPMITRKLKFKMIVK